ncbi:hypothetical protein SteCoe_31256 [Stentor coeruleus]|uniref:Tyrosine-protein kinase ephrin type A/B receptor-like domain-containing protein n=1 Tax=Stentor coeruleus TaxID=5963 RepID=A0A1R2B1S6_9CILI|nr:hypothetical protein SteCoe_31256 [Stentor coeruleus]
MWKMLILSLLVGGEVVISYLPYFKTPPCPRLYSVMEYLPSSDSLLIFGGALGTTFFSDIWEFSLSSQTWSEFIPTSKKFPDSRIGFGSFSNSFKQIFYIFGGNTELGPQNDLWAFDILNIKWYEIILENLPPARYDFAYTSYIEGFHQYFAIFGGITFSGLDNNLYILNMTSLKWTLQKLSGNPPIQTRGSNIVYYNGCFILTGGFLNQKQVDLRTYRYYLNTSFWEDITSPSILNSRTYTKTFIHGNYLYLVFGWDVYMTTDAISIIRLNIESQSPKWEVFIENSDYARDSFGLATVSEYVYIFAGYSSANNENLNSIIYIDLVLKDIFEVTSNYLSPENRYSGSLSIVNGEFYLFGGKTKNKLLNDLWIYNVESFQWSKKNNLGFFPSARFLHAADSQGDAIIIWGGEDSSGLKNDLFIFNALTNYWGELIPRSSEIPSAAKGACLVSQIPLIFLYGGLTSSGISKELWIFFMGNSSYMKISEDFPVVYHTCVIIHEEFYVIFGSTYGEEPISRVRYYNFLKKKWATYYDHEYTDVNPVQGIQLMINGKIIVVGGQAWQLDPIFLIQVFAENTVIKQETLSVSVYASSYAYYKKDFYSFGGGSAIGTTLRLSIPSSHFIKISLSSICANDKCDDLCSSGTYSSGLLCEVCPKGSFSEGYGNTKCQLCGEGTFNAYYSANSNRQCYPCPEGSYSSNPGANYCLDCITGMVCPAGSKIPIEYFYENNEKSIQPQIYKGNADEDVAWYFQVSVFIVSFVIVINFVLWGKLRKSLMFWDLFEDLHNHELNFPMIRVKNKVGGFFSLVFFGISIIIIGSSLISFNLDNIQETKALVPLVIMENEVSEFVSPELVVISKFLVYGDSCEINNVCNPLILVTTNNIKSTLSKISCSMTNDKSCIVTFTCYDCSLSKGTILKISLLEKFSYASGIEINITSDSSIPNSKSSVSLTLQSSINYIFIGSEPSKFFFTLTPSIFRSESSNWPDLLTGYHVSSDSIPIKGSEFLSIDLPIASQLKLEIYLDVSLSSLYTNRYLKQDLLFALSTIIGSVFGILGAVGSFMRFFESYLLKSMDKYKQDIHINNIKNRRKILKDIFGIRDENLDIAFNSNMDLILDTDKNQKYEFSKRLLDLYKQEYHV